MLFCRLPCCVLGLCWLLSAGRERRQTQHFPMRDGLAPGCGMVAPVALLWPQSRARGVSVLSVLEQRALEPEENPRTAASSPKDRSWALWQLLQDVCLLCSS